MSQVPITIIMVEDDQGHARLIERSIRRAGVNNEIVTCASGTEAMAYLFGSDGVPALRTGAAYLLLLDLNLPDMSGVDILRRLKEDASTKSIPVVVLTTTASARRSSAATTSAATSTSPSR